LVNDISPDRLKRINADGEVQNNLLELQTSPTHKPNQRQRRKRGERKCTIYKPNSFLDDFSKPILGEPYLDDSDNLEEIVSFVNYESN
jgi:hypothetical protein